MDRDVLDVVGREYPSDSESQKSRRSGTEVRKRNRQVNVRMSEEEYDELAEAARYGDVSVAEVVRRRTFR